MIGKYTHSFMVSHVYNNTLLPSREIPACQQGTWFSTSSRNRDIHGINASTPETFTDRKNKKV